MRFSTNLRRLVYPSCVYSVRSACPKTRTIVDTRERNTKPPRNTIHDDDSYRSSLMIARNARNAGREMVTPRKSSQRGSVRQLVRFQSQMIRSSLEWIPIYVAWRRTTTTTNVQRHLSPPPPLPPGVYARVPLKLLTRVKRAHGELKPRDIKAKRYPRLGPLTVILYGSTWAALPECEGTEPRNFY